MAEARAGTGAEAQAQAKKYIDIFINSAPLGCTWPSQAILIANGQIYLNRPGERHAEIVFLDEFEETESVKGEVVNMYLNYSPCDECCTAIDFLTENSGVTFNIKFAHVYYYYNSQNPTRSRDPKKIREGLRKLDNNERINLKAIGEEDWKEIMTLILRVQGLDEWAQGDVEEWSMTKGSILGNQGDLEQALDNALNSILHEWVRQPVKDIMAQKAHENWGTEVGDYFTRIDKRYLHNKTMQVMYNHGEGSLTTIVNAATGEGYAFLLHVLRASREAEMGEMLQLLRKRIIADFVADKEFRCIIDKQIDGEADAAVGNEAAAAAE